MGSAVLAAIDPPFQAHHEQPPHAFEISSNFEERKNGSSAIGSLQKSEQQIEEEKEE